jgi:hypothetical protein
MIPVKEKAVNWYFGLSWYKKALIPVSLVLLALLLVLHGSVSAQSSACPPNAVGFYTKDGVTHWIVPGGDIQVDVLGKLSPSEMEARYPMSVGEEQAIVHEVPPCPVVIDGVTYKPEDISLFNGVRLRFVTGKDGILYAFTTPEGLEKFLQDTPVITKFALLDTISTFYKDIYYAGDQCGAAPGCGFPYLSTMGYDDTISSVQVNTAAFLAYLYDYANYRGDYFVMLSGSSHYLLALEGWNDRASSVYVAEE